MPNRHGPGTHNGYLMPPPGHEITKHQEHVLRIVYGDCRVQNPGEDPESKAKCARIAWSAAKRA
jgi:hypothetical protein